MSEDLPTLDRPMKANSGRVDSGQLSKSGELVSKVADWICTSVSWMKIGLLANKNEW